MADVTNITPLNFNDALAATTWLDKKTGVEVSLGYISGLPLDIADITYASGDIALAMSDAGVGQKELDIACQLLAENVNKEPFQLLVTKSDFPFDSRWYLLGDLIDLIELAQFEKITMPFGSILYDEILDSLNSFKRQQ